jgi:HK97 family phage major capsid protein
MTITLPSTTGGCVRRLAEVIDELEQLQRHDKLTRAQEERAAALDEEVRQLKLQVIRLGADDGALHREAGSYSAPDETPEGRSAGSEARSRALDTLARSERGGTHLTRSTLDHVARLVESDETDLMARWVTWAGDPAYLRAVHTLMRNPTLGQHEWTEEERQAFGRAQSFTRAMSLTDAAGGFMVPLTLDPSIMLSSAGTSNRSLRSAFTVKQTATDTWSGVTSAGVTASWDAEAAEVSDDAPTLGDVTIPVYKGAAFVPFSIEVGQDAVNFASEMAALLAEAKENLEAAAFITGTGSAQPTGIVTAAVAASKTVASATADTYAVADVYALKAALPARWRSRAAWLANEDIYDKTRQFATGTGPQSSFWTDFGGDTPAQLLGKPVYESSEVDGTLNASQNNYILAYGDLKQFVVVDRVGAQIELIPHLFGANRRPTGQRGFYMHWRTGSNLVVPDAVRVLNA